VRNIREERARRDAEIAAEEQEGEGVTGGEEDQEPDDGNTGGGAGSEVNPRGEEVEV